MRAALPVTALAGLLLGPALAQEPARTPGPRLHLVGKATLEAAPDHASVSIEVTNRAATTAAAIDATSAAAAKIVTSARTVGIEGRDIQTSYVSLQPAFRTVRDANGSTEQRPDGYTASNTVGIRVRDLARLGEFLRVVVDGGANRIGGVDFALADPGRLERDALAAAVRDARRQAEVIAEAAGVAVLRIEEIRYGSPADRPSYAPRRYRAVAAAPPPREAVPVESGALEVSAEVEVIFAIGQPG